MTNATRSANSERDLAFGGTTRRPGVRYRRTRARFEWTPLRRLSGALIGPMVLTVLATSCGSSGELRGNSPEPPPDVRNISLPNAETGADTDLTADEGQITLVFFGFTHCPDICPTTLADAKRAIESLDSKASRVTLAMISVDPKRDAPKISDYVKSFDPNGVGLITEDQAELTEAAEAFGASFTVTGEGDDTEVTHSGSLYAVDDTGHVPVVWAFNTPSDDIANDLEALLS